MKATTEDERPSMSSSVHIEQAPEKNSMKKEIWEWVKSIAIALIAVALIRMFLFTMIRVDGHSMDETLQDNERIAVTILDMKLGAPQRQDIVICTYPGEDHLCVKRVIGLPGETIELRDGKTYINEVPIEEPYIEHLSMQPFGPYEISEDHYFVMGDNRADSKDSRYPGVGALQKEAISGKARLICWPFDRFQLIG